MADIDISAAPRSIMRGTRDGSLQQQTPEPEARPQHFPFTFLFAQEGDENAQAVSGTEAVQMYGADTFDLRSKFANHATVFAKKFSEKGNLQFIKRLKPEDAAPPSTLRLWADVLVTQLDNYERNADGSIKLDGVTGLPKIVAGPKIPGHKVKFVLDQVKPNQDGDDTFGIATQAPGDQADVDLEEQSIRIPLFDVRVSSFGKHGDNKGIRIWAPTAARNPSLGKIVSQEKAYPFRIACVKRATELTSPALLNTNAGAQYLDVALKPGLIDRTTDTEMYIGDVFLDSYRDIYTRGVAPKLGPFGEFHVYDDQIAALLLQLYNAEKTYGGTFSDFKNEADEQYRFNLFGGASSKGSPYHSYQIVTGVANSVRLSETTNLMAAGGSDGTMNDEVFATLVEAACAEFLDPNSPLKNMAKYPFSCIYDSGFPITTKEALCNILAQRKNTYVILGTHVVGGPKLNAAQETSVATALLAAMQMFPESEYYGTSTMRGMLLGGSGRYAGSQFRKDIGTTIEFADKASEFMGAGDGRWKSGRAFDIDPNNRVTLLTNLNVDVRSDTTNTQNWNVGLVTPDAFDRRDLHFPAFQTVYPEDDSVLNSFFTMACCADLQLIGDEARRKFSGRSDLSDAQFVNAINDYVAERVLGRYDNRFVIQPKAFITAADAKRGYSWNLKIEVYAPGMKTVQTLEIEGNRIEDLE